MTKKFLSITILISFWISCISHAQISCEASNLWVNGDFENTSLGNHCNELNPINAYSNPNYPFYGYTTFIYTAGGTVIQPGILNEPLYDHTTGAAGGHYLYLDPRTASGSTYQIKQQIKVKQGMTYTFSLWVTSMLTSSYQNLPASLELKVNGTSISTTPTSPITIGGTTTNWILITGSWYSPTDATVDVEIDDIDPTVAGHDFAIDDIFFGAGDIEVSAGNNAVICTNQQIVLGGQPTADFGATCNNEYTYSWSPTTGFITAANIANPTIQIATPGSYTYTVTATDLNGQSCSDDVTVTVGCDTQGVRCEAPNLWVNGDFENASVGNHCNELNPVNAYSNPNYPNYGYTTFIYTAGGTVLQPGVLNEPLYDHTTWAAGGHYLYLDPRTASGSTYQIKQQIKVKQGWTYTFGVWVTSMLTSSYQSHPAGLELKVNGTTISTTPTSPVTIGGTTTNWTLITGSWYSPTDATVDVEIDDIDPTVAGHDFAIDDIFFGAGDIETYAGNNATICTNQQWVLGGQPTANYGATCNDEYTYNWSPITGFITAANIANPTIQVSTPGNYTYTVTVTDLNGQSCSDDVTITVEDCSGFKQEATFIKDNANQEKISIYPNPTTGIITIDRINNHEGISLFLYNDIGSRKIIKQIGENINIYKLDLSSLDNGIYYYRIVDKKGNILKSGAIVKN